MNGISEMLCRELVEKLVVPAFCTRGETIVATNDLALSHFSVAAVGESAYTLFPEMIPLCDVPELDFEVMSDEGTVRINVSPLGEFRLWQLTFPPGGEESDRLIADQTRLELNMLMARVNLMQKRCPNEKLLCGELYRGCCRLFKAALLNSKAPDYPMLYTADLSVEASEFVDESQVYCKGLGLELEKGPMPRFAFASVDKLAISGALAGLLALCAHKAKVGGCVRVSTSYRDERAMIAFEITRTGTDWPDPPSEADYILTRELINKNLRLMNGTFFTSNTENGTAFYLAFLPVSEDSLLCEPPTLPVIGLPYQLIHLSAMLPGDFYNRLH